MVLVVPWRCSCSCLNPVEIMDLIACSKAGSGLFRRQIPLRLGEHFVPEFVVSPPDMVGCQNVPNEEFSDAGAAK